MDMEEVPIKKDTTYMLAPPPPVDDKDSDKGATAAVGVGESSLIIFCVDVSGSMNTMSQVGRGIYSTFGHCGGPLVKSGLFW